MFFILNMHSKALKIKDETS